MIEPESSEFWIDSGANVRLVFGELAGILEMECLGGGMVVYARQAGEVDEVVLAVARDPIAAAAGDEVARVVTPATMPGAGSSSRSLAP